MSAAAADSGRTARRVAMLAVVAAVAIAIATTDFAHEAIVRVLDAARAVMIEHPRAGKVLFVLVSALSAMLAFFSSAIVVPVAVYTWGDRTTLVLLWLGWLAGGGCSYLIGRAIGRGVARWFADPKLVEKYSSMIAKDTSLFTVFLFQLALPSEVPGYVLGAVRYAFWKYAIVLALAELPFAAGAVYLGDSFVRRDFVLFAAVALAGVLVTVLAFRRFHDAAARVTAGSSAQVAGH